MSKTNIKFLIVLAVSLLMTGCGAVVDFTKTSKGHYSATNPNNVEILQTLPKHGFVELGTFSTYRWNPKNTAKMHNALREKSSDLGADAVVIQSSGINQASKYSAASLWCTGVAVKFTDQLHACVMLNSY